MLEFFTLSLSLISTSLIAVVTFLLWRQKHAADNSKLISGLEQLRIELTNQNQVIRNDFNQRLAELRTQQSNDTTMQRQEVLNQLMVMTKMLRDEMTSVNSAQGERLEVLRKTVESHLSRLQHDNNLRLEDMRKTVAEKLEGTLERRLGESFRIVSERLELVHKGLGEMQSLAVGVGDLKKIMSNVKSRGSWGEVQLFSLLDQILAPEQFSANVETKPNSNARVEFAIKLPGPNNTADSHIWLPIDAKFPLENYHRLTDAQDHANPSLAELEIKQLEVFIKNAAKDIAEKYVSPPYTTDFAVMYLPTEGLFAEVSRRLALVEMIQREYRIVIAGPTTLAALLNSLQMGFKTLAIQKRSSEVWEILGAVKSEFLKFNDVLKKVEKKLAEAGNVIESVHQRSRVITKRLKSVEESPLSLTNIMPPQIPALADDDGTMLDPS